MSRWGLLDKTSRQLVWFGAIALGAAFLLALSSLWGRQPTVPASSLVAIFGMWCWSAAGMMRQMREVQAREDMRRIARGEQPE